MKQLNLWAFALLLFISFSCKQNSNNVEQDSANGGNDAVTMPVPNDQPAQPRFQDAKVESLEIISEKNQDVFVMVHGMFSRPCETLGNTDQTRDGNNIKIVMTTLLPPGADCPEVPVPMHHSVPLNTKDLAPGKYTVEVNGQKGTFVIE